MAAFFDALEQRHIDFIDQQHMFFVATAAEEGDVNLSPKGMDSLHIVKPSELIWMNYSGSGNETAAHILQKNRMTLMWCSYDKDPLILRVYGSATAIHPDNPRWATLASQFGNHNGARQIFEVSITRVQTSCGFAVPFYEFVGERTQLSDTWEKRGNEGLPEYWVKRNATSIDGFDTGITEVADRLSKKA